MNKRIAEHMDPKLKEKEKTAEQKKQEEEADRGVPKIAGKLKEENIFTNPPRPKSTSGTLVEAVSTIAKAHGNTPHKPLTEGGRMLIGSAKSAVLTPEQEKNLTPQGIWAALEPYARKFLGSPVGWPFQQTYRRRITNVVLGTPYGEASIILDAVDILSRLAVCSLTEDSFGYVQRDIPDMIKNFSGSIATLEKLKQNIGFHWTDVEKNEHAPEVDAIILALKKGLQNILDAFGAYFNDLKISRAEVRVAEKAAMIEAPKKTEPAKEKTKEKPKEKPEEKPKEMSERRRR
jgi:nucleoporin NDC1